MNHLIRLVAKSGLLKKDFDYHLIRASMVIVFLMFGYGKWFEYEAEVVKPFISHSPIVFWLIPAFGVRGASWFLGISELTFGVLLFLGFWNKRLGVLGAVGSIITYASTFSIIPFLPNAWAAPAGGFPAMTIDTAFLLKDIVLLAASVYLLRQDVIRSSGYETSGEVAPGRRLTT